MTIPDTAVACRILKRKKISVEGEKAQPMEAMTKIKRQAIRTGRLPYLSDKGPNKTCNEADATMYNETESCMMEKFVS